MKDSDIITVRLDIFGCKTEYDFYNALAVAVLKQTASKVQLWMDEARDFLARLTPRIGIPVDPGSEISVSLGITPETHSPGVHSGFNEKRVRSQFDLGSPSNFVRLRDALIERDLVFSELRRLYVTDPVFALWFKRRFL